MLPDYQREDLSFCRLLMDCEFATVFQSGPQDGAEEFMALCLILPGFKVGLRHASLYVVKITNPAWSIEDFHAAKVPGIIWGISKDDCLKKRQP